MQASIFVTLTFKLQNTVLLKLCNTFESNIFYVNKTFTSFLQVVS